MHGLFPPAVPIAVRSPPPSFHYTSRSMGKPLTAAGASRVRDGSRPPRTKVERYQPTQTSMSYIEQFEQELIAKLNGKEDNAAVVRWVAERVLESYKNGITAGQKGAKVIRKGESRRRGAFGKAA